VPNFVKIGQSITPPSCIFKFVKCYRLTVSRGASRITVPNFINIGCSVAKILRFFEFSTWPSPPFWIFEIAKFYCLLGSGGSRRIFVPNFVKIGQSVAKILRFFSIFQDGGRPPYWIRLEHIWATHRVLVGHYHSAKFGYD